MAARRWIPLELRGSPDDFVTWLHGVGDLSNITLACVERRDPVQQHLLERAAYAASLGSAIWGHLSDEVETI